MRTKKKKSSIGGLKDVLNSSESLQLQLRKQKFASSSTVYDYVSKTKTNTGTGTSHTHLPGRNNFFSTSVGESFRRKKE